MATTINSITGVWLNWEPSDVDSPSQDTVAGERLFRWGAPLIGLQSALGFKGSSPPSQSVGINDSFSLGTIKFYNYPILGEDLEGIDLEITVRFNAIDGPTEKFILSFDYIEGDDTLESPASGDTFKFASTPPIEIEAGDLKLVVGGFTGGISELFALETSVVQSEILAVLKKTPFEGEDCEDFEPLFQPVGCTVRPVCPIDDGPIIEDCGIPEAPGPIIDCPEIDLVVGSHGSVGIGDPGPPGPPGPQGPQGPAGPSGCNPRIQVAYSAVFVYDCLLAGVSVTVSTCPTTTGLGPPDCCFQINFIFYICWYPALPSYFCCLFIWCDDEWKSTDPYLCEGLTPPGVPGDYPGDVRFICRCTTSTTTSTTTTTSTQGTGAPCNDWMIMICNSNAVVDDNFSVELNGTGIGNVTLGTNNCSGKIWKTNSGIPSSLIAGQNPCCEDDCEVASVNANLFQANNILFMDNIQNNHNGNWGVVRVIKVRFDGDAWVLCSVELDDVYDQDSGEDKSFAFP